MKLKAKDFPKYVRDKNPNLEQTLQKRASNDNTYLVINGMFGFVTLKKTYGQLIR